LRFVIYASSFDAGEIMQFGVTQARLDQFDVLPRRGDASLGLLLEGVKHLHDAASLTV
jgi:hypothetical protein